MTWLCPKDKWISFTKNQVFRDGAWCKETSPCRITDVNDTTYEIYDVREVSQGDDEFFEIVIKPIRKKK